VVDGPECLRVPADHEVGIQMALDLFSRGRK
jgi:hypothetical protein